MNLWNGWTLWYVLHRLEPGPHLWTSCFCFMWLLVRTHEDDEDTRFAMCWCPLLPVIVFDLRNILDRWPSTCICRALVPWTDWCRGGTAWECGDPCWPQCRITSRQVVHPADQITRCFYSFIFLSLCAWCVCCDPNVRNVCLKCINNMDSKLTPPLKNIKTTCLWRFMVVSTRN